MSSGFTPELGQLVFGGGNDFQYEMEPHVEAGLRLLGELVAPRTAGGQNPTDNVGDEFTNDVFALRSYCWCDNDRVGHENGCPSNFVSGDFAASWYKHLGRGSSQSRPLSVAEWTALMSRCLESL